MNSLPENNQKADFELEDALRTYPIIPAPAGFSGMVMDNVRVSTPMPQFRLSWIDYALTFFATSMIALTLVLWRFVPVQWIMRIKFQAFVFWEYGIRFHQFTPLWFVVFILVFIVMLFSAVLFRRPCLMITSQ